MTEHRNAQAGTVRRGVLFLSGAALVLAGLMAAAPAAAQEREIAYKDIEGVWHRVKPGTRYPGGPRPTSRVRGGGITFTITYMDVQTNNNIGFDDPTFGAARRATLEAVLLYIDSKLSYTNRFCDVTFDASQTDGSGALAFAGTSYLLPPPSGFQPGLSYQRIHAQQDFFPDDPEISGTVDFGYKWNSEMDAPANDEVDLYSTLLHEITHGLGVSSLVNSNGTSDITDVFTTWDDLLFTVNGKDLFILSGDDAVFNGVPSDLTGGGGGIVFRGNRALASYGSFPPIHAPGSFQNGSSISHWAPSASFNPVMLPSITFGATKREYAAFEVEALGDLGWEVSGGAKATPTATQGGPTATPTQVPATATRTATSQGPTATRTGTPANRQVPANTRGSGALLSLTLLLLAAALALPRRPRRSGWQS